MKLQDPKPQITDADIKNSEQQLNIKFPEELKEYYKINNGGHSEVNLFELNGNGYKINEFLPLKYGDDTIESTYKEAFVDNSLMPKDLVPFAADAGGDYFCFSIKENEYGNIYFYESEYYDNPARSHVFLANSLSEFLEKLVVDI